MRESCDKIRDHLNGGVNCKMDILTAGHELLSYRSKRFSEYFDGLSVAVFDIETSGLYPSSSKCILGGLLLPAEDRAETIQFFADTKKEEPDLLSSYCDLLAQNDVLISYNGNSFDLPFLSARLAHHRLPSPLGSFFSFDLYRAVHHYSSLRSVLPNLRQKTVEYYLGLSDSRKDEISGEESVRLYEEYLRTGSASAKEKVLLHNRDDLIQLTRLLAILDKLDLHRILYHEGFPVALADKRAFVRSISFGAHTMKVTAETRSAATDYYAFETGYQAAHQAHAHSLTVEIPFEKIKDASYADLTLLPVEEERFAGFTGCSSGYLILRDENGIKYAEVNRLVRDVLLFLLRQML